MHGPRTFEERILSTDEIEKTNSTVWRRWLGRTLRNREAPDASGLTLPIFLKNNRRLVATAIQAIRVECYEPFPAVLTTIFADKERPYMRPAWIDRWVLAHVGRLYAEAAEPHIHSRVFSYRPGRGQHTALKELSAYVLLHKGVHVVRGDISEFGETLDHSALLQDFVETAKPSELGKKLFTSLSRYPFTLEGRALNLVCGLPMGSHLQLVAENLYLRSLDERLSRFTGSFYARFGDDIIAAHPDAEVVLEMQEILRQGVIARGLTLNINKTTSLTLCGPRDPLRRRSMPHNGEGECRVATRYLGREITFDGRLLLPLEKFKALDALLSSQLRSFAKRLPQELPREERTKRLCQALRAFLSEGENNHKSTIRALMSELTDSKQLAHLDRRLCELVLSLTFKRPFRKSFFRTLPPQRLREFGFESLIHLRRVGKL